VLLLHPEHAVGRGGGRLLRTGQGGRGRTGLRLGPVEGADVRGGRSGGDVGARGG